jgi:hypothetical protein
LQLGKGAPSLRIYRRTLQSRINFGSRQLRAGFLESNAKIAAVAARRVDRALDSVAVRCRGLELPKCSLQRGTECNLQSGTLRGL